MALFLLLMMLSINVKLTFLVFIVGCIFGAVIRYASKTIIYRSGTAMTRALGEEDIILAESLGGIHTIKVFLAERKWVKEFVNKVSEYIHYGKKTNITKEIPLFAMESFIIAVIAFSAIIFKRLHAQPFGEFLPIFSIYALSMLRIIPSLTAVSNSGMN